MQLTPTRIPGLWIAQSSVFQDHRGGFSRLYCRQDLKPALGSRILVQINLSMTHAVGAVRGLHYQVAPHAELKIVRCLRGQVFDVAVDLRRGSPTFLQWVGTELSPDNRRAFIIPEGCAHGFQVLEADSELLYLHTAAYTPQAEGGVRYNDPRIGIAWPLPPVDLSARDAGHPLLDDTFEGIAI